MLDLVDDLTWMYDPAAQQGRREINIQRLMRDYCRRLRCCPSCSGATLTVPASATVLRAGGVRTI